MKCYERTRELGRHGAWPLTGGGAKKARPCSGVLWGAGISSDGTATEGWSSGLCLHLKITRCLSISPAWKDALASTHVSSLARPSSRNAHRCVPGVSPLSRPLHDKFPWAAPLENKHISQGLLQNVCIDIAQFFFSRACKDMLWALTLRDAREFKLGRIHLPLDLRTSSIVRALRECSFFTSTRLFAVQMPMALEGMGQLPEPPNPMQGQMGH